MNKEQIEIIVDKLKKDSLTKKELYSLKEFIYTNSDESVYEALELLWQKHQENYIDDSTKNEILQQIELKINNKQKIKKGNIRFIKKLFYAAACIISLLLFNYFILKTINNNGNSKKIETSINNLVVRTEKGERANILLPDSSVITLNGGTELKYPQNFDENNRNIDFTGEAYFKVARNEHSTFTINVEDFKVEVLGTEFNVNTIYNLNAATTDAIELSLISGKVKVTAENLNNQSYYINSGEKAIYNKIDKQVVIEALNNREIAWLTKKLIFNATTLDQLFVELEKTFGVTIHSNLPQYTLDDEFTAFFENKSLNEILIILNKYYRFKYRIDNSNIYITAK